MTHALWFPAIECSLVTTHRPYSVGRSVGAGPARFCALPLCEVPLRLDELPGCNLRILSRWAPFWLFTLFLEFDWESMENSCVWITSESSNVSHWQVGVVRAVQVETGGSRGLWPPQVHESSGWGVLIRTVQSFGFSSAFWECHQKQRVGKVFTEFPAAVRRWMRNVGTRRGRARQMRRSDGQPQGTAVQHTLFCCHPVQLRAAELSQKQELVCGILLPSVVAGYNVLKWFSQLVSWLQVCSTALVVH